MCTFHVQTTQSKPMAPPTSYVGSCTPRPVFSYPKSPRAKNQTARGHTYSSEPPKIVETSSPRPAQLLTPPPQLLPTIKALGLLAPHSCCLLAELGLSHMALPGTPPILTLHKRPLSPPCCTVCVVPWLEAQPWSQTGEKYVSSASAHCVPLDR